MEQIYFTRQEKLAIYKEAEEQLGLDSNATPVVIYAVRNIDGYFWAYANKNIAMLEVLNDLENLYGIDYEEKPLAFTDMNTKWGWEQCWMEKFMITPCV